MATHTFELTEDMTAADVKRKMDAFETLYGESDFFFRGNTWVRHDARNVYDIKISNRPGNGRILKLTVKLIQIEYYPDYGGDNENLDIYLPKYAPIKSAHSFRDVFHPEVFCMTKR